MKNKLSSLVIFVSIFSLLCACKFTISTNKDIQFKDGQKFKTELEKLLPGEKLLFQVMDFTLKDTVKTELRAEVVDSNHIPKAEKDREQLARSIANLVKQSLKEGDIYDDYVVAFISKSGGVLTVQTSTYAKRFRRAELN